MIDSQTGSALMRGLACIQKANKMMSQQPEFEYPEQEKRVINHDPREQRGSPGPSYQPPASIDEQQMGRQKIYPARSRKPRRWLWALALVAAIPALLAGQQYLLAGQ